MLNTPEEYKEAIKVMLQEATDNKLYRIAAVFIASYITNENRSDLKLCPVSASVINEITSKKDINKILSKGMEG